MQDLTLFCVSTNLHPLTCVITFVSHFKFILPSLHIWFPWDVESIRNWPEIFNYRGWRSFK